MQAALSFAFPWAGYFTSEAMELSGIVTILFCGMIMAVYTRYNFSDEARVLTAQGYKCVALVAETYVFVYLGMAVFTFPIFNATVWMLVVCALLACFVGRLHIYTGSWLTNCCRADDGSTMPKISGVYMFVMWFSGLRGGVAFALASVSYAAADFADVCGGLPLEERVGNEYCSHEGMNDSLAILQTTLLIATFTIFVFGGAITEIAIALDVLAPKGHVEPVVAPSKDDLAAGLRGWLTFDDHHQTELEMDEMSHMRAGASESTSYDHHEGLGGGTVVPAAPPEPPPPEPAGPNLTTAQIKAKLASMEASSGVELSATTALEDKLDELRAVFPGKSSAAIKKLLDSAAGDVQQAIISGQSKGFTD